MMYWNKYVPVAERRRKAQKKMEQMQKKGQKVEPVNIEGRLIAKKFWGKKWCDHLETFADYSNRLPRGRTYARNGSICHLSIQKGTFKAYVSGSSLYQVTVTIKTLAKEKWEAIKNRCGGQIGSILELLQGKISSKVMEIVADHKEGLFPNTKEMEFSCSCPDWAGMCKHVAAILYGVGNRLDHQPELLFLLRGVDPSELIHTNLSLDSKNREDQLNNDELGSLFGIDIDNESKTISIPKDAKNVKTSTKNRNTKETKKAYQSKKRKVPSLNLNELTGIQLKTFREKIGFSVSQLADALNVTPASIYRWEQNPQLIKLNIHSKEAFSQFLRR